jgi:hypothetical protein
MREMIALLVFLVVAGLAIVLATKKRIGNPLAAILLAFSLISGWGIANYDWIKEVKWQVPGLAGFRKQITEMKESAVDDIGKETDEKRSSLGLLVSSVNDTLEQINSRKQEMEILSEAMKKTEEEIRAQEQKVKELNAGLSELALLLTKITWLQFQAVGEPSNARAQVVTQRVMDSLDEIVALVIPDPQARSQFVSSLMNSLPQQR